MKTYKQLMLVFIVTASVLSTHLALAETSQFKLDQIMANRGDAMAQFSVAIAYEDGLGVTKDPKQAFEWYSKAANQGHKGAQYKVGTFYDTGMVVKKDPKMAMQWYKKAASGGSRPAQKRLDEIAMHDRNEQLAKQRREKQQQEEAAAAAAAAKAEQERQAAAAKEKASRVAAAKAKQSVPVKVAAISPPKPKPVPASKRVDIPDLLEVVANNSWKTGSHAADYLPSRMTKCAQVDNEVICFSDERVRIVNGKKVTYTTKAVLNNFRRDGTFRVTYVYNALRLESASGRGVEKDVYGLRAQEGWQEPQLVVNCKTTDKINLYCSDGKLRFHYVR